jgi:hypothetical protein
MSQRLKKPGCDTNAGNSVEAKPKKPNKPNLTLVYRKRAALPSRESDKGGRNATPSSFFNAPPARWRRVPSGSPSLAAWHALAAE